MTFMNHAPNTVNEFLDPKLPEFGYALDVGANDGIFLSNTLFLEQKGWNVICVEPNPLLSEVLKKNRKQVLCVACDSCDGTKEFVSIGGHPYPSGSGFHTKIVRTMFELPENESSFNVPTTTINRILDESGFPRIDYITIDVEGHELEVLKGCDLNRWTPKFICAESWGPVEDFREYLESFGYSRIYNYGYNRIYERHQ